MINRQTKGQVMTHNAPNLGNSTFQESVISRTSGNDNSELGFKDILADDDTYEISRTNIPARCSLPLKTDMKISKHLTVISGIIHITLGDDIMVLVADESIYIPQGVLHGLENRADTTALVVSVDYIA